MTAAVVGAAASHGQVPQGRKFEMFTMFPLLALSLLAYALISLATGGSAWAGSELVTLAMASGEDWLITGGDLFVFVSLFLLFIEVLRSTKTGTESILNHAFSAVLSIACVVVFMMVPMFATSTFFVLVLMTLLDFMAGFMVTTLAARRDFGISGGVTG
ncbi:hypothetical protein [Parvularcula maris]|uniref:Uncharacterized protein n=1 Tax=Parvularcula maris TaxID=2965077 RepID=A0A9X2L6L9_9PROT|nr:hypothetical protein [Parvularcula maris]MCQ8184043.1 hypothetical protein [Parvularcula maris]